MSALPPKPNRPRPVGNRRKTRADLQAVAVTEADKFAVYQVCRDELRRMKAEGLYAGDPETWHPAAKLARLIEDPTAPHSIQLLAAKELLSHYAVDAATRARIEAGVEGPAQISIRIESYAQGHRPAQAAIEPPPRPALDMVTGDRELEAHRGSAPTPAPKEPAYQTFHVEDGNAVVDSAGVIPAPAFKPKRYVYDQERGDYVKEEG